MTEANVKVKERQTRLDTLTKAVIGAFPKLSKRDQAVSLAFYRLLAKGSPVSTLDLAQASDLPVEKVEDIIESWNGVYADPDGGLVGYWGLALAPMKHRFSVNGNALYTWCAWDALFIPPIIGQEAEVASECPVSGRSIVIRVTPQGVATAQPSSTVISFLTPERTRVEENVLQHFCHYVHFFASSTDGAKWVAQHPGTFLLSLADAWELGRRKNAAQYKELSNPG